MDEEGKTSKDTTKTKKLISRKMDSGEKRQQGEKKIHTYTNQTNTKYNTKNARHEEERRCFIFSASHESSLDHFVLSCAAFP